MTDPLLPLAEKLESSFHTSSIFTVSHTIKVSIAVQEGSCWTKRLSEAAKRFLSLLTMHTCAPSFEVFAVTRLKENTSCQPILRAAVLQGRQSIIKQALWLEAGAASTVKPFVPSLAFTQHRY